MIIFASMKHLYITLLSCLLLAGCARESEVSNLQKQIDDLKSDQIASINNQIASIQQSIARLESTDTEVRGYLQTLNEQRVALEQADKALSQSIADLRTELKNDLAESESSVLAIFESYKETVASQISSLNNSIDALTAKDNDLQTQINDLKLYVDGGIQGCKDWITATFATLEQFNETATAIAGIQTQISTINQQIQQLTDSQALLASKEELNQAISTLDSSLQSKIQIAVNNSDAALQSAKDEISSAYTVAIQTAISSCESSIKTWVNQQLTGYYTAAQADALLEALRTDLEGRLNAQKTYLEGLLSNLETTLNTRITTNKALIDSLLNRTEGIGNELSELTATVATNSESISQNSQQILSNAKAIAANASSIDSSKTLINENKRLMEANSTAIQDNRTAISALKASASGDSLRIVANASAISKNAQDIAGNAGLISSNAVAISNNAAAISDNAAAIIQLRADLSTAKTELTEAYTAAIQTAISTLDGKLAGQIADSVSTVNSRLDNEIGQVRNDIASLSGRVAQCESDIQQIRSDISDLQINVSKLLARIQSLTYIPRYSDGKARVFFDKQDSNVQTDNITLDFEVHPNSAAEDLASIWEEALSMKAVPTIITRAIPSFVDIPIISLESNAGIISLTADATSLPPSFFSGDTAINACLSISDGSNDLVSEYVPIIGVNREIRVVTLDGTDNLAGEATLHAEVRHAKEIAVSEVGYYYGEYGSSLAENGTKLVCELQADGTFQTILSELDYSVVYYMAYAIVDGNTYFGEVKSCPIFHTVSLIDAEDLGLSVRWATKNLGATKPEEFGYYYAWGETAPESWFGGPWYKWGNGDEGQFTKYNTGAQWGTVIDNLTRLCPEDDAAYYKLGAPWRMPTHDEMKELMNNCEWTWTTQNGVKGYAVSRGKACIFLPASGYREGAGGEYGVGDIGWYLSSEILADNPLQAYCIHLDEIRPYVFYSFRTSGYSVRPVYDPDFALLSGMTLSSTSISLVAGQDTTLSVAAYIPADATYKSVTWSSSDKSVAVVDASGKVTAVAKGTAVITATAIDGSATSASCNIRVLPSWAVDMGDGIYWSSCNLGASNPEDYGDYYAWGEITVKEDYDWSTYKWCDGSYDTLTKYNTKQTSGVYDGKTVLEYADDAARQTLGDQWRVPTLQEWKNLYDNCSWTWTSLNGKEGYLVTAQNGNSIFLPAAGERMDTVYSRLGMDGSYWASSILNSYPYRAYFIGFDSNSIDGHYYEGPYRCNGLTIRPVSN